MPVEEALARILAAATRVPATEMIAVEEACGRVLAADLAAQRTQPPFAVSSMDGFALRAVDTAIPGQPLALRGESAAGRPFSGAVGTGEAVRIFTGARVPEGADAVLLQERAQVAGDHLRSEITLSVGTHIRRAGLDFSAGEILLKRGQRLSAGAVALAAAMNHAEVPVARRPRIALLATGDELVPPGADAPGEAIIASNVIGIAGMIRADGAEVIDLGIARDTEASLTAAFAAARDQRADCLVTIGGASVGRHDLVRPVAQSLGAVLDFYKIALRPGKPLNFGSLGPMLLLGLPGNPVSALVCAFLFLRPLVKALQGDAAAARQQIEPAILGRDLPANDERQDYLRATLARDDAGQLHATPLPAQDSSLLSAFARADALLVRPSHAPPARAGAACHILRL